MIEDKIWSEDPNRFIIGADEVGRGSFAGPICAAAVKINYSHLEYLSSVKDSKKLSAKKAKPKKMGKKTTAKATPST